MSISRKFAILMSAITLAATSVSAADAGGIAGMARHGVASYKQMHEGPNTLAPFAFIRYCVNTPAACRPSQAEKLDWSWRNKAIVVRVNRWVNRSIRPINDQGDSWDANVRSGDCEDFALTKRLALLKAGLPASALRIAVATTASGEGHAVLVVKTNAGDFVLDNRSNRMLMWHQTDLTFIKIASAENPRLWRQLL